MTEWLAGYQHEVLGGLVVAVIVYAVGLVSGMFLTKQRYERKYDAAADIYVKRISDAIDEAIRRMNSGLKSDSDPRQMYVQARIIVGTRNDLRDSLTSIYSLLNSHIDQLARQVENSEELARSSDAGVSYTRSLLEIGETIRVLSGVWKSKAGQVRIEIRKLLTELGLIER